MAEPSSLLTDPTVWAALAALVAAELSWQDPILIAGGLFLTWTATRDIHHRVDPGTGSRRPGP